VYKSTSVCWKVLVKNERELRVCKGVVVVVMVGRVRGWEKQNGRIKRELGCV